MKHAYLWSILCLAPGVSAAADWSGHPVNQWMKQSPREGLAAPPLKYEGSGAINPVAGRWIHFGGHDGIPQGFYASLPEGTGLCCEVDEAKLAEIAKTPSKPEWPTRGRMPDGSIADY
jgi:hypothetical protein